MSEVQIQIFSHSHFSYLALTCSNFPFQKPSNSIKITERSADVVLTCIEGHNIQWFLLALVYAHYMEYHVLEVV